MKIVVLTTDTPHHTFFVNELKKSYSLPSVIVETKIYTASFETEHQFERAREKHEREVFFNGHDTHLKDIVTTFEVESVNNEDAVNHLKEIGPDVIVVFGTGLAKKPLINTCPQGIINLHGGNPEEYRGLDSHLWAIYHGDFSNITTTLHRANEKLDDGEIILQSPVRLYRNMELYELRRYNTEACVKLVVSSLDMFQRYGYFISGPQRKKGRYYSFMPAVLKEICVSKLKKYTETLP